MTHKNYTIHPNPFAIAEAEFVGMAKTDHVILAISMAEALKNGMNKMRGLQQPGKKSAGMDCKRAEVWYNHKSYMDAREQTMRKVRRKLLFL